MSDLKTKNLYELQSLMANAIMRPLNNGSMQKSWSGEINTSQYAEQFIKPNKRSSSFERLEIYNKQYWYRLLACLQDDFPGLNAILGHKRFEKLLTDYISFYPSRSYSLNDLGKNLASFILENPSLSAPDLDLAYDMVSVEWAEIKAFNAQAKPAVTVEALQKITPSELVLQIQPYLSLLELKYEIDSFLAKLDKEYDKSIGSNAVSQNIIKFDRSASVRKRRTFVVIHRVDNTVYYKRLDKDQYFLLKSLIDNKTLAQACNDLISTNNNVQASEKLALKINKSFTDWMELGWFANLSHNI